MFGYINRQKVIFAISVISALQAPLHAQNLSVGIDGTISTFAGPSQTEPPNLSGYSGDGGPSDLALLANPTGVAFDAAGNLYIADYSNNVVRKVSTSGVITTIAGNHASGKGYSGDGGPAISAQLDQPSGLAIDKNGNLFIVDNGNSVIRKVDPTGTITTVVGDYSAGAGYAGDGGPATAAQLNLPLCAAFDTAGNLYITDTKNNVVRMVNAQGVISTVAGSFKLGAGYSGDSGQATSAQLNHPAGLSFDSAGNLYIADQSNNVIRGVSPAGIIGTFAGTGAGTYAGDGGPALSAGLSLPLSVEFDSAGDAYIGDAGNQVIRKVDPSGIITTIAGYRIGSSGTYGSTNGPCYPPDPFPEDEGDGGPASWACLGGPFGMAFDKSGNLYFADAPNNSIREITMPSGSSVVFPPTKVGNSASLNLIFKSTGPLSGWPLSLSISLGTNTGEFALSSPPSNGCTLSGSTVLVTGQSCEVTATFQPTSPGLRASPITVDGAVNMPFGTYSLQGVGVGPLAALDSGIISTVAGNVAEGIGYSGNGGPATRAQLLFPLDVATDSAGNLYVLGGYTVRKIDAHGFISTIAGVTSTSQICSAATDAEGDGCPATQAAVGGAFAGITVDAAGNIYLSDDSEMTVRKINAATGIITRFAGNGSVGTGFGGYAGDGRPATSAQLGFPAGLAIDTKGNLYIAEVDNSDVRKVDTNGIITTVAGHNGNLGAGYSGDGGPATGASLLNPEAVQVDQQGNIYISDTNNYVIRKVDTKGIISTVAGVGGFNGYDGDGGQATSAFLVAPWGLALDPAGDLYISSPGNVIRKVDTSGIITTVAGGVPHTCTNSLDSLGDGCLATQATFGPSIEKLLPPPNGISFGANGSLYVVDGPSGVVREITPNSVLNFGPQPVSTSAMLASFLYNTGNAPLHLAGSSPFSVSGTNAGDFTVAGGLSQGCEPGATVAPGSFCTIAVTFTPSAAASRDSTLAISSDASNAAYAAEALEGTGTVTSGTSTNLTSSASNAPQGTAVTLIARVTPSSGSGTPTGTVIFQDGSTSLGSGLLSSSGMASYSTSSLPIGSTSITAGYEGDSYFSSSTSAPLTVVVGTPGIALTNSGNVALAPGATTGNTVTITVAPTFGFTGTVSLACAVTTSLSNSANMPTCNLSTSSVSVTGSASETSILTVNTTAASGSLALPLKPTAAFTGGAVLALLCFFGLPTRRRRGWLLLTLLVAIISMNAIGCGGGSAGASASGNGGGSGSNGTPLGTYTITVTGTAGNLVQTTSVALTVN